MARIEWTTGESDMISLEDDIRCAKMPCGHYISSESMADLYRSQLSDKKYQITCPDCRTEWPYHVVRDVAQQDPKNRAESEMKLAENFMRESEGLKQCPSCKTWISRIHKDRRQITCQCGEVFCWKCLNTWVSSNYKICGNQDCGGWQKARKILTECDTIDLDGHSCPATRACPRCATLITHTEGCKSMICLGCKCEFCFVCLAFTKKASKGNYIFSCHICKVAPPQITEPYADGTTEEDTDDTTEEDTDDATEYNTVYTTESNAGNSNSWCLIM